MRKVARRNVVKRLNFQDLDLRIEFPTGSKRPYRDDAGNERFKTMHADYGEVAGTEGLDGDPVDVYVGPDKSAPKVFVVTQMKKGDWSKVDEEKCILGVHTKAQARELYLAHYNDQRFCGAIKEMSMDEFKQRLATKGVAGQKIAQAAQRIADLNYLRMQAGDPVLVRGHGVKVAAAETLRKNQLRAGVSAVPAMTAFGETQPGAKVALDWADRLKQAAADPDPNWDNDLDSEVKRKMKKQAPAALENLRNAAIAETKITEMEQKGLGIPDNRIEGDPKDSKMRKAASRVFVDLFVQEAKAGLSKRAALSDRAGRIADRVDDVGIGMLASPYAAKAVGAGAKAIGGALSHRGGRLGAAGRLAQRVGAGADKAYGKLHDNTGLELGGLALVAPGVTHNVAKKIDKRLPSKTAGIGSATMGFAKTLVDKAPAFAKTVKNTVSNTAQTVRNAATAAGPAVAGAAPPVAAKPVGRLSRAAGATVGIGAAGVGLGMYGGKKLLTGHPHEGLSAPSYQPPRLY
jgi:hypothetical protein